MLTTGTRLGPYEIQSPLGAGGMGAVYKARDTRLDRTVAIKVLSGGPISTFDLRQRFEREAKAISALQHPHICTLFDIGSESGTDYLVMEYVDGETLSSRIRRGPMPLQQVLKLGVEVADALDRAHRAGLIHRDIKPANIMLTRGGAKLLDFGLAKAAGAKSAAAVAVDTALTAMTQGQPLTQEGMIVGTYQYMAPEQIEGAPTDARTDLFAFGCVLYEAATGRPAFPGKTQASVIAAILASEPPPMTNAQPLTPPGLERIVRACLLKDPEERIQSAHDAKLQLGWLLDTDIDTRSMSFGTHRRGLPWYALLAVAIVVAAVAVAATLRYARAHTPAPVIRSSVILPDDSTMPLAGSIALSPDGQKLAYVAQAPGGKPSLWIRPLNSLDGKRVDDSDEAAYPFWSPDSRYVAFFSRGKLRKLDTSGWTMQNICDADDGRGGAWAPDGTIVFSPEPTGGLLRVSDAGGQPVPLTKPPDSNLSHRWPQFLPDGNHVLFLSIKPGTPLGDLMVVSVKSGESKKVASDHNNLSLYSNHKLLWVRGNTLLAQSFDPSTFSLGTDQQVLAEGMNVDKDRWTADLSASNSGLLVYRASTAGDKVQLTWLDMETGKPTGTIGEPGPYYSPVISPDGSKIVVSTRNAENDAATLWLMDAARGVATQLIAPVAKTGFSGYVWTADSKSIIFGANRAAQNRNDLYIKNVNSSEPEQLLWQSDDDLFPFSVSPDNKYLIFGKFGGKETGDDVWMLPLHGDGKPAALLATKARERGLEVSPDGRWLAYNSDETGRFEVYVTTFPRPTGKWQVSTSGGTGLSFRRDGKMLAYVDLEGRVFAADYDGRGAEPQFGRPRPVVGGLALVNSIAGASATPDWKRLVAAVRTQTGPPRLTLVTNWLEELKKK